MNKFDKTVNKYLIENVKNESEWAWHVLPEPGAKPFITRQKIGPESDDCIVEYWTDKNKIWFHREDGPAYENEATGYKGWWFGGKRHRLDGPAVEGKTTKEWFINGKMISEEDFNNYIKKTEIKKEISGHKNNRIDPGMLEDYL